MALFSFLRPTQAHVPQKPILLTNTLGGKKEVFTPLVPGKVRMYNCGPTVYDKQHIGNFRAFIFADTLRRMFEYNGYRVKQVINITDVGHLTGDNLGDADTGEDKVEKKAREEGKKVKDVVRVVTNAFFKDLEALNAKNKDTEFPKASDNIPEQIAFVKTLEEKGYAYKISDGIYFDTSKFKGYGKLGNIDLEGLQEGARVENNPEKHNPTDFALWKFSKKDEKRQQEWDSPWGVGFPGWHLECSALAMKYLGKRIDVHTGGIDHIPTHHNNEIAQTESVTGQPFANYWMHVAHLMLEGKKISKSEGRCVYIQNITDRNIPALAYRYLLLTAHYSSPMNFTWDALIAAQAGYFRLHRYFVEKLGTKNGTVIPKYSEQFHAHINDDLNTPQCIALLHEIMKDEKANKADIRATFLDIDRVLGLGLKESNKRLLENLSGAMKLKVKDIPEDIQTLIKEREAARKNKEWERADRLREEIESKGYAVVDTEKGASISKTTEQ